MKKGITVGVGVAIVGLVLFFLRGTTTVEQGSVQEERVPITPSQELVYAQEEYSFDEIETGFSHVYDADYSQFLGAAAVDLDGDITQEIYVTGGAGQNDAYLVYRDGAFVDAIDELGIDNSQASYGIVSADINNSGETDLLITRQDGVYAYYNNGGIFEEYKIPVDFEKNAVPVDITIGDIDNDGDFDMYISTFIAVSKFKAATFNDPNHVQKNILLRNDGDKVFTDITKEAGLEYSQNTFTASFVELNGDEFIDLVVSPNTDHVRVYKNNNGTFTLQDTFTTYGFWMGIGIDDIDNDGDVDLFFSNSGTTVPKRFATGDLRDGQEFDVAYSLIRNDGDFTFTDITEEVNPGLPFGWGIVAHDFGGDNTSEWLIMQNYIKWPGHKINKGPGTLLTRTSSGYDNIISESGLGNRNYGFSALIGDFTGDTVSDVAYLNVNGPLRVLAGGDTRINKRVAVVVPEDVSSQGLRFELVLADTVVHKSYNPKQGIMTDQGPSLLFSLGNQEEADLRVFKNQELVNTIRIEKDQQFVDLR